MIVAAYLLARSLPGTWLSIISRVPPLPGRCAGMAHVAASPFGVIRTNQRNTVAPRHLFRAAARAAGALLLLLFAVGASAAMTLRVGIYSNPPKVTLPHGGIFVDVLEHVASHQGYTLQYVPGTFQEGLTRLEHGEIDLMVDVAKTPERERRFDFTSTPVLQSWNTVYARRGSGIHSLLDLQGRKVAVLAGSVQEQFLREAIVTLRVNASTVPYGTYEQAFEGVRRGAADAVVANPYIGGMAGGDLEDTSIVFGATTLHYAVRKGDGRGLVSTLDAYLGDLSADPDSFFFREQQRLLHAERDQRLPGWVLQAIVAAAVVLAVSLGWAYSWQRAAARLRQGEARQRQLAEEFQRVFDSSIDMILVLDETLLIRRASPAVRTLGYEPGELAGQSVLTLVSPAIRSDCEAMLLGLRGRGVIESRPAQALHKDGTLLAVSYSAAWSKRQQELFCVIRDETELHALLRSVALRSEELDRANDDLQIVSSSLSHDLGAPLAAIRGFVSYVLEKPEQGERNRRMLARAEDAAARMEKMVADLASVLQVAGEPLHPRTCDVSALAAEVAAALAERMDSRVDIQVAPGLQALGDPKLLRVVLENLLGNALKFSSRAQHPIITIGQVDAADGPIFFVRDNGVGFDAQLADKLFRPFSRLHSQDEFEGSGVGLTIVHRIVLRHGGRLWAEGSPGEGATFYFTLGPRKESAAGSRASAPTHPAVNMAGSL